ncbi:MAG: hypothetical protein ABR550_09720 [Wenzhouxiangellaceae bacterium]
MWLEFTVREVQKQAVLGYNMMIENKKNGLDVGKMVIAKNTHIPTKGRSHEV